MLVWRRHPAAPLLIDSQRKKGTLKHPLITMISEPESRQRWKPHMAVPASSSVWRVRYLDGSAAAGR